MTQPPHVKHAIISLAIYDLAHNDTNAIRHMNSFHNRYMFSHMLSLISMTTVYTTCILSAVHGAVSAILSLGVGIILELMMKRWREKEYNEIMGLTLDHVNKQAPFFHIHMDDLPYSCNEENMMWVLDNITAIDEHIDKDNTNSTHVKEMCDRWMRHGQTLQLPTSKDHLCQVCILGCLMPEVLKDRRRFDLYRLSADISREFP